MGDVRVNWTVVWGRDDVKDCFSRQKDGCDFILFFKKGHLSVYSGSCFLFVWFTLNAGNISFNTECFFFTLSLTSRLSHSPEFSLCTFFPPYPPCWFHRPDHRTNAETQQSCFSCCSLCQWWKQDSHTVSPTWLSSVCLALPLVLWRREMPINFDFHGVNQDYLKNGKSKLYTVYYI